MREKGEFCVCGNRLGDSVCMTRISPCRCEEPGSERKLIGTGGMPEWVTQKQIDERDRCGLPRVTDIERGASTRWV